MGNARVRPFPFPHFFIEDVFPPDLFDNLRRHLPPKEDYQPIAEGGRVARAGGSTEALYPEGESFRMDDDVLTWNITAGRF